MNSGSVMLVGGPGSGKTNYIARLWLAFKERKGALRAECLPTNIQYVDDAVRHLMARRFAPRSERNIEDGRRDFVIDVRGSGGAGAPKKISVPDITGELWRRAVETYELPQEWIDEFKDSSSAILFLRAHTKLNAQPMDWVTARDILNTVRPSVSSEPLNLMATTSRKTKYFTQAIFTHPSSHDDFPQINHQHEEQFADIWFRLPF